MLGDLAVLLAGLALMAFGSRRSVTYGVRLAKALRMPPFWVGALVVSIGTDIAEILHSIVAATKGRGDIAAGDAIGSVFTQSTLILALLPIAARGSLIVNRRQVIAVCALTCVGLGLAALVILDGEIQRVEAAGLALAWLAAACGLAFFHRPKNTQINEAESHRPAVDVAALFLWIGVVAGGAALLVDSLATLATIAGIPAYVLSFLLASFGTSLPELAVDITAVRRGEVDFALGDLLGSCLVDSTLALAAGPLVVPTTVGAPETCRGILVAGVGMVSCAAAIGLRAKHDAWSSTLLLAVYLGASYLLLNH